MFEWSEFWIGFLGLPALIFIAFLFDFIQFIMQPVDEDYRKCPVCSYTLTGYTAKRHSRSRLSYFFSSRWHDIVVRRTKNHRIAVTLYVIQSGMQETNPTKAAVILKTWGVPSEEFEVWRNEHSNISTGPINITTQLKEKED